MEFTRQHKLRTVLQFVNMDGKWKIGGDAAQALDDICRTHRSINVQRLRAPRMRDHKQDAGQARHVIGVHMRQADCAQLAKTPAQRLPGHLRPLSTIDQHQL